MRGRGCAGLARGGGAELGCPPRSSERRVNKPGEGARGGAALDLGASPPRCCWRRARAACGLRRRRPTASPPPARRSLGALREPGTDFGRAPSPPPPPRTAGLAGLSLRGAPFSPPPSCPAEQRARSPPGLWRAGGTGGTCCGGRARRCALASACAGFPSPAPAAAGRRGRAGAALRGASCRVVLPPAPRRAPRGSARLPACAAVETRAGECATRAGLRPRGERDRGRGVAGAVRGRAAAPGAGGGGQAELAAGRQNGDNLDASERRRPAARPLAQGAARRAGARCPPPSEPRRGETQPTSLPAGAPRRFAPCPRLRPHSPPQGSPHTRLPWQGQLRGGRVFARSRASPAASAPSFERVWGPSLLGSHRRAAARRAEGLAPQKAALASAPLLGSAEGPSALLPRDADGEPGGSPKGGGLPKRPGLCCVPAWLLPPGSALGRKRVRGWNCLCRGLAGQLVSFLPPKPVSAPPFTAPPAAGNNGTVWVTLEG